jgi:septin 3/9/12
METSSTTRAGAFRCRVVQTGTHPSLAPASWDPIIKYIKDQHSAYLRKELTAMRDKYIVDTRIHCCLYFIAPTGHSLKAIDITVMKKLSEVVNVVPVIAKSDSLTLEERELFKQRVSSCRTRGEGQEGRPLMSDNVAVQIRAELAHHSIRAYPFDNDESDAEEMQLNEAIRVRLPPSVPRPFPSLTCLSGLPSSILEHDPLRRRWLGAQRHH